MASNFVKSMQVSYKLKLFSLACLSLGEIAYILLASNCQNQVHNWLFAITVFTLTITISMAVFGLANRYLLGHKYFWILAIVLGVIVSLALASFLTFIAVWQNTGLKCLSF
jgi:hypothetical protein